MCITPSWRFPDTRTSSKELGVDKSKGMDSYDYMLTYEAITIDSRMMWRARTPTATTGRRSISSRRASPIISGGTSIRPIGTETSPIRSGPIRSRNSSRTRAEQLPQTSVTSRTLPLGGYSFDTRGTVGRTPEQTVLNSRRKKSSALCLTGFRDMCCSVPGISVESTRSPTSFAIRES